MSCRIGSIFRKMTNRRILPLWGLTLIIVCSACTTQKRKGELSSLGKLYHNTTAHYNGYFNADELLVETFETLRSQHVDNYNQLLPIFEYVDPENPKSISADLDKAIEKVSVVVNLHRESKWTDDCYLLIGQSQFLKQDYEGAEKTFRYLINEYPPEKFKKQERKNRKQDNEAEKENIKVKDMTKKQRQKAQKKIVKERKKSAKERSKFRNKYNQVVRTNIKRRKQGKKPLPLPRLNDDDDEVEEVASLNDPENAEDPNTEEAPNVSEATGQPDTILSVSLFGKEESALGEENPEGYFLKHRPAFQEGMLWLAKALIERDNYDAAVRFMDKLDKSSATFLDVRQELAALQAYYQIKRKQSASAIDPLLEALERTNDKNRKARYAYILGQLYEMNNNPGEALNSFDDAARYANDYELVFSAKLAKENNLWRSGNLTNDAAIKNLEKMLKDFKNIDYQDRIYFTMATIALASGDQEQGIKYLEQSLKNSSRNALQKTESYYKLANLYFQTDQYIPAKNYFDSTLQVMPETDKRYVDVKKMSTNLTGIAENLETISLQDSLIKLSLLSEEEKKALAYDIKKAQLEAQRQKLVAQANKNSSSKLKGGNANAIAAQRFSSNSALGKESTFFAYDDRALKRGKRNFANQWGERPLTDNWRLSSRVSSLGNQALELSEEIVDAAITDEDLNNILKEVPKNDQEREIAHLKIKQAMFDLGKLYRDVLQAYDKSVQILEQLDEKYPGHNFELDSWYYLYLVHGDLKNPQKQAFYKQKIIEKFPSTTYAKILTDPNYLATLKSEEQKLALYYEETYQAFQNGQYKLAIEQSNNAKRKFGADNSYQPRFALLSAMCIGKTQGKEPYKNALKEVIGKYPNTDEQKRAREILRLLGGAVAALPGGETADTDKFKVEDNKLHYIICTFDTEVNINEQKNAISDYNKKYHKLDKLRITPLLLGQNAQDRRPIIVVRRFKDKFTAMQYYQGVQRNRGDFLKDKKVTFNIFAVSQNNYRQILRSKSMDGYETFFNDHYAQ